MSAKVMREIVQTTIRRHPGFYMRPNAVDMIVAAYERRGLLPFNAAIKWAIDAIRYETIDPDCYPLPFWPDSYPSPIPTVPLADWL